jgi:hypothetical protein
MVIPLLEAKPSQMTNRARGFLAGTAALFGTLAGFLLFHTGAFESRTYTSIRLLPLWLWGGLMAVLTGYLVTAAWWRNRDVARWALVGAAVVCGLWTAGFVAALITGDLAGPTAMLFSLFATFVILLQCVQPLRVPLEEVVEQELSRPRPVGG